MYVESISVPLETLVGNILGCIQVPPPGGPQVRFSIGAGDRQALQPPISSSLPVTHTAVNLLFQQLGEEIKSIQDGAKVRTHLKTHMNMLFTYDFALTCFSCLPLQISSQGYTCTPFYCKYQTGHLLHRYNFAFCDGQCVLTFAATCIL